MSSDRNDSQQLPDGWVLCRSKSIPGRKYYFNKRTGKSSWSQPQADDKPTNSKKKSKKEKSCKEKNKKEELKKCLRRKRNSTDDESTSKKKRKHETPTPEKRKKKDSTDKYSSTKNIASTRLSQLRARLSLEAQESISNKKSPVKANKQKATSKNSHTEVQTKASRVELKSPNLNDSKCSTTTQSPSSDSLQSIPSPSQFFAANKIISSMKAQLPEEYCNKVKQKDTFADIEQGICNQTPEYPSIKHPATPPQFSEASKLVSAIKSKLTYKPVNSTNKESVKTFTSAKERMEVLRTSLSSDVIDTDVENSFLNNSKDVTVSSDESMEVEDCKIRQTTSLIQCTKDVGNFKENVVLVVDTNIFIHELDFIKNVLNSHIKGYNEQPTLLIPWRVINELDRLKDNNNGNGAVCKRAKSAMDYLYKSLPENNRIKGQSLRDANSHIYPCELPDDEILNCSLQQAERGKSVILLTNDKNLCNKAVVNNIKCIGLNELKGLLENKLQESADPDSYASVKYYETTMYQLLANILENEMRAKYNNLWQHVLFKAPPWTLSDVLQCLLKHWFAVFTEVFPRIEHLLNELKNALDTIQSKEPDSLFQSEVSNFKELCLDVARKCQIIPEYMELAKLTVKRLQRALGEGPGGGGGAGGGAGAGAGTGGGEGAVVDAFEGVWTVFSSYCAKLSSGLGIMHNVEDKLPGNDPLDVLTSKWALFSNQITSLTLAIKGALSVENDDDPAMDEQILRLESVFKESLTLICMEKETINKDNLRIFCTKCRNMLQEAYTKFSQLAELLDVCKNTVTNK